MTTCQVQKKAMKKSEQKLRTPENVYGIFEVLNAMNVCRKRSSDRSP